MTEELAAAAESLLAVTCYVDNGYCSICHGRWPNEHREHCQGARMNCVLDALAEAAELARDGYDAQLEMTVARLGGMVEGRPTARLNFLQRIDELRELERSRRQLITDCNSLIHAARLSVGEFRERLNEAVGVATGNR